MFARSSISFAKHLGWFFVFVCFVLPAQAEQLSGKALVDALRQGGYVVVMRHASSPFQAPDKATADPENIKLERQLDAQGRETAQAMGVAVKKLTIPFGEVLSSPTYRARETVKLVGLAPKAEDQLAEGPGGMAAPANKERAAWLKAAVAKVPRAGTNTLIVTHTPNILAAFGKDASGIAAGEALVFHGDAKSGADLIARVKITEWPELASKF
jgi:phosphohistidine phosphatase SixA